jgi:hypothetical protein
MSKRADKRRVWPWVTALIVAGVAVAVVVVPSHVVAKRVLCIGDSLTSGAAQAVISQFQAKGFDPEIHAIPGSGLLDTKVNWAEQARQLVAQFDPDVVIVEFIGDYGLLGERPGVAPNSSQFFDQWASASQQLENDLTAHGAQVYWVLGPPVAQPGGEHELLNLDYEYQALRASNTSSGRALTINETLPFSSPGGGYSEYLPNRQGQLVQMRTPDGTHMTQAGDLLFAETLVNAVESGPTRPFWHF